MAATVKIVGEGRAIVGTYVYAVQLVVWVGVVMKHMICVLTQARAEV